MQRSNVPGNRVGVAALFMVFSVAVLVPVLARWIEWMVKTGAKMEAPTALLFSVASWVGLAFVVSVVLGGVRHFLRR